MQGLKRSLFVLAAMVTSGAAWAQQPRDWQMGFQRAHSPVQQSIAGLHALVIWLMALVTIFVAALILFVVWRYRASKNPTASRVSHHTALEVAWTLIPVLLLVVIAIPSFRLVYFEDRTEAADLTIKVTGHRWYWEYTYPDQGGIDFSSYMIKDEDRKPEQGPRNLAVDNHLVVPAGKNIRVLTTSGDVIHSFFVPSLGVQRYAIPGRTIETWFKVDAPGIYYGECNQICGENHSLMPIAVEAMTEQNFTAWVAQAKTKFASADAPGAPSGDQRVAAVVEAGR